MTPLALDTDHHALAVNVGDLETTQFGAPHGGGVQDHEQGAVKEITGVAEQASDFL